MCTATGKEMKAERKAPEKWSGYKRDFKLRRGGGEEEEEEEEEEE